MQQRMQMEQEQLLMQQQKSQKVEKNQRHQLISENEDREDDDRDLMQNQNEDLDPTGYEGRGGALVEEARRLMQEDDGDEPRENDNVGPKIKMNRIGKKGKKGPAASAKETDKSAVQKNVAGAKSYVAEKSTALGGFSE